MADQIAGPENAGLEINARLENGGLENAGLENVGLENRLENDELRLKQPQTRSTIL